jgi:hypothetical protein
MFDQVPAGKMNDLCSFSSKPLWILNMVHEVALNYSKSSAVPLADVSEVLGG